MNSKSISVLSSSQSARKLWDSILKSIIHHMPEQLFPLLKHIFGKGYPKGTPVKLLAAEYAAPGKSAPQNLSSIFADVVMQIAGTDIYHLECQTEKDEHLSFRMFEYDTILHFSMAFQKKIGQMPSRKLIQIRTLPMPSAFRSPSFSISTAIAPFPKKAPAESAFPIRHKSCIPLQPSRFRTILFNRSGKIT